MGYVKEAKVAWKNDDGVWEIDTHVAKRIFMYIAKQQVYVKQGPRAYRINVKNVSRFLVYIKVWDDNILAYSKQLKYSRAYIEYLSVGLGLFSPKEYKRARRSPGFRGGAHVNYYRYITEKGERQAIKLGITLYSKGDVL